MGGCKWWWQKSQTIVGMPSWGPPNSPCLSEGSSGVGLGPYQFGSCTVRMCSATTYCRKTSGWAQTPRGSHLTATTKALCLCRRESEQLTLHPGAWNSLPSNIFLLKTHSKDYSHRKVCKQDNLINFIFKRTPKTTKAIQNKTCWMKTVNNFFTALTKKKKNDIHLQHFLSKFTWQRLKYCFILTQHTTALCDWLCYSGKSWDLWTRKSGAH